MNLLSRFSVACVAAATAALAAPAAAQAQQATVTEQSHLRAAPHSSAGSLALLPAGARIDVDCWARGEATYGTDRYGSMWLRTSTGGWIHSMLVSPVSVGECGGTSAPAPALPLGQYENCDAARAAGPTPLRSTDPGYGLHLDRDRDGLGCEPGEWDD